jgi:hypothetical protein
LSHKYHQICRAGTLKHVMVMARLNSVSSSTRVTWSGTRSGCGVRNKTHWWTTTPLIYPNGAKRVWRRQEKGVKTVKIRDMWLSSCTGKEQRALVERNTILSSRLTPSRPRPVLRPVLTPVLTVLCAPIARCPSNNFYHTLPAEVGKSSTFSPR